MHEDADDYPLPPALEFLKEVWALDHALERVSTKMERALGVTAQQRLILRVVGRFPGLTAGRLASLLHVDPGTASAAFRRLESRGLLERRRDPLDRRRVSLGLTAAGRKLDRETPGTVESAVTRTLAAVRREDLEATERVLRTLTASLRTALEELRPPAERDS